jgi:RNA polymerase sigma-70 factor (ECF subfamily)
VPDPLVRNAIDECRRALPGKPAQALSARLEGAGAERDETLAERLGMKLNTFLQNVTRAKKLLLDCLRNKGVPMEELA